MGRRARFGIAVASAMMSGLACIATSQPHAAASATDEPFITGNPSHDEQEITTLVTQILRAEHDFQVNRITYNDSTLPDTLAGMFWSLDRSIQYQEGAGIGLQGHEFFHAVVFQRMDYKLLGSALRQVMGEDSWLGDDWKNHSSGSAKELGFPTTYARKNPMEFIAEVGEYYMRLIYDPIAYQGDDQLRHGLSASKGAATYLSNWERYGGTKARDAVQLLTHAGLVPEGLIPYARLRNMEGTVLDMPVRARRYLDRSSVMLRRFPDAPYVAQIRYMRSIAHDVIAGCYEHGLPARTSAARKEIMQGLAHPAVMPHIKDALLERVPDRTSCDPPSRDRMATGGLE